MKLIGKPKFWKSNESVEGATALQVQRAKQIESLQQHNFGVAEVQRDVEYRLSFTAARSSFTLFILLPPEFPQCRPNIRITPSGQHPWLSDSGELVACPALSSFSVQSNLGMAVKAMVEELTSNPPRMNAQSFQQQHSLYSSYGNAAVSSSFSGQLPTEPQPHFTATSVQPTVVTQGYPPFTQPSTGYSMPDIPSVFPELRQLSAMELQTLLEDESMLLQRLGTSGFLEQLVTDVKDIAASNELLATTNLALEPEIEEQKVELIKKHEVEKELRSQLDKLSSRQQEMALHFSPEALQDNLRIAASESEEASDEMAESFLSGGLRMDEFLKKFLPLRTVYHARRIREEKLQNILANDT